MSGGSGGSGSGGRSGGGSSGAGTDGDAGQSPDDQMKQLTRNLFDKKITRSQVEAAHTSLQQQEQAIWDKYKNPASKFGYDKISAKDEKRIFDLQVKRGGLESALQYHARGIMPQ